MSRDGREAMVAGGAREGQSQRRSGQASPRWRHWICGRRGADLAPHGTDLRPGGRRSRAAARRSATTHPEICRRRPEICRAKPTDLSGGGRDLSPGAHKSTDFADRSVGGWQQICGSLATFLRPATSRSRVRVGGGRPEMGVEISARPTTPSGPLLPRDLPSEALLFPSSRDVLVTETQTSVILIHSSLSSPSSQGQRVVACTLCTPTASPRWFSFLLATA